MMICSGAVPGEGLMCCFAIMMSICSPGFEVTSMDW